MSWQAGAEQDTGESSNTNDAAGSDASTNNDAFADDRLSAPPSQNGNQERQSYLDRGVAAAMGPALIALGAGEGLQKTLSTAVKEVTKLAPLLTHRTPASTALTAGLFASDEASPGDTLKTQLVDAGLGASKGLALKGTFALAGRPHVSPAMTGLQMGVMARFSDTALTRQNYFDKDGHFSLNTGLTKSAEATFRPEALAIDAATFGLADTVWSGLYGSTRGALANSPLVKNAITGASMAGAASGGLEATRQVKEGTFDPAALAESVGTGAFIGGAGGALGGWHSGRALKIDYSRMGIEGLSQKRAMPDESTYDAAQMALRDGRFEIGKKNEQLTTDMYTGKVTLADGTSVPAIFRPHDGANLFQRRLQTEVSGYNARATGLGDYAPLAVPRTVEINGVPKSGYIQEMAGRDLNKYLAEKAQERFGGQSNKDMLRVFRSDKALQEEFAGALANRMVMGEWDNHALNMTVVENGSNRAVKNIDMAASLADATSSLHLRPQAHVLGSWESLNKALYRDLAGKPIPASYRNELDGFLQKYDSPDGRINLQNQTGWSQQQIEGVIGRSRWFVENSVFPEHATQVGNAFPSLVKAKRALKSGLGSVSLENRRLTE